MNKELIMGGITPREVFMAALLSSTSDFADAKVRLLKNNEDEKLVNVTSANVRRLCPTWASSTLISDLIRYRVCGPIIDETGVTVDVTVKNIRKSLEKYAKEEGIEMPV